MPAKIVILKTAVHDCPELRLAEHVLFLSLVASAKFPGNPSKIMFGPYIMLVPLLLKVTFSSTILFDWFKLDAVMSCVVKLAVVVCFVVKLIAVIFVFPALSIAVNVISKSFSVDGAVKLHMWISPFLLAFPEVMPFKKQVILNKFKSVAFTEALKSNPGFTKFLGFALVLGLYIFGLGEFVHYFVWKINMRGSERRRQRQSTRRIPARFRRELIRAQRVVSSSDTI